MQWLYDTHIHLSDPEYMPYLKIILDNMACMHTRACCVSMDNENSTKTLELSKMSNLVLPFIGIHPEKAHDDLDVMVKMIKENIEIIAGIGEIGLDPAFCNSDENFQRQKYVFENMLSLAEKYDKPVSIHSRKSLDTVFSIMSSYSINNACLHWFDGNKKQLQKAMDMDFFVSYGPVMVYANDKQNLLSKTNNNKILTETDGPVRFSRCFAFKPAQTAYIPSVVFTASKILGKSYDETCSIIEDNSKRFLAIV